MILLEKKRIMLIIAVVFVSISFYLIQDKNAYETVQTVSLPVTNKVVILDAGHRSGKMKVQSLQMV